MQAHRLGLHHLAALQCNRETQHILSRRGAIPGRKPASRALRGHYLLENLVFVQERFIRPSFQDKEEGDG